MSKEQELLPCPFCGGEAEAKNEYVIHCANPFCEAQPDVSSQSTEEAREAWNRRAALASPAAEPVQAPELPHHEALQLIVDLSAGWDDEGSTGPRPPMSWESVGRMSMDYARAALASPPATKEAKAGWQLAPDYRGYAHLGTGQYAINVSDAGEPAEVIVSIATDAEKANRRIGERRDNPPGTLIQPEQMAVRLRFASAAGLDAFEDMLKELRAEHFPEGAA